MRKRLPVTVALAALMAGLLGPATAGSAEARIHTLEYAGGGVTAGPARSTLRVGEGVGAVEFRGGPERFVSIEIEDAHGLPVAAVVMQPEDAFGTEICGATKKPLKVRPYESVTVFLMNGECGAGASVATTGTVTATFTRK